MLYTFRSVVSASSEILSSTLFPVTSSTRHSEVKTSMTLKCGLDLKRDSTVCLENLFKKDWIESLFSVISLDVHIRTLLYIYAQSL